LSEVPPTSPPCSCAKTSLQCHKLLGWQIHEPDAPELTEIDPGGILIDVPHTGRRRLLDETAAALRDGAKVL